MIELTTEQRERVKDFVKALRSGEYKQTDNQLGRVCDGAKSYCCEGVAAERYAADVNWSTRWLGESNPSLVLIDPGDDDENSEYAPDEFWEMLGFKATGPNDTAESVFAFVLPDGMDVLETGASSISFMGLNDSGVTFAQIADLIEWQYLAAQG